MRRGSKNGPEWRPRTSRILVYADEAGVEHNFAITDVGRLCGAGYPTTTRPVHDDSGPEGSAPLRAITGGGTAEFT